MTGASQKNRVIRIRHGLVFFLLLLLPQVSSFGQLPRLPLPRQSEAEQEPAVLKPEEPWPAPGIVFVRRDLAEAGMSRIRNPSEANPSVVVRSLHCRIMADSPESLEVLLQIRVMVPETSSSSLLTLPLQGCRLVDCRIDGQPAAMRPEGSDSIAILLPGAAWLTPVPLNDESRPRSATAVSAAAAHSWTEYLAEVRLRPVLIPTRPGLQFRVPLIPCLAATMEVSDSGLFSGVRAQAADGIVQWNPADGKVPLQTLSLSDGIEVRLFQAAVERGSPEPAGLELLIVDELLPGQQQLTCLCRFSQWNMRAPEVRYRIPNGFEISGVSSLEEADATDLLYTVSEQNAVIQLPQKTASSFLLSIQLRALATMGDAQQTLPLAELQQFADCAPPAGVLLAVRTHPVFSLLPLEGNQITALSFSELQGDWGQWLRRTDSIFRIPRSNPECTVRQIPRISRNEIRISQKAEIHDASIELECRADIETFAVPVFRHHFTVNADMTVTEVQVVAGEANRLASWHRRGDLLTIQLREATIGLHAILIRGTRTLRPDDSIIRIHPVHIPATPPLESSITIEDSDGTGLALQKFSGARPDIPIEPGEPLIAGQPVRMQVISESEPLVLERTNKVEPEAAVAAVIEDDRVTLLLQVSRWPGSRGPLQLSFDEAAEFLSTPVVFTERQQLPLTRERNEFFGGPDVVRLLFGQSEFTVMWSVPIAPDDTSAPVAIEWPGNLKDLRWSGLLIIPVITAPIAGEYPERTPVSAPAWLASAASRILGVDLARRKTGVLSVDPSLVIRNSRLSLPAFRRSSPAQNRTSSDAIVIADSAVRINDQGTPFGQTGLVVLSPQIPSRIALQIPEGTLITMVRPDEVVQWKESSDSALVLDLMNQITEVSIQWIGKEIAPGFLNRQIHVIPPWPVDSPHFSGLTVLTEGQPLRLLTSPGLEPVPVVDEPLRLEINTSLTRLAARGGGFESTESEIEDTASRLTAELSRIRLDFLSPDSADPRNLSSVAWSGSGGNTAVFALKNVPNFRTAAELVSVAVILALALLTRKTASAAAALAPGTTVIGPDVPPNHSEQPAAETRVAVEPSRSVPSSGDSAAKVSAPAGEQKLSVDDDLP